MKLDTYIFLSPLDCLEGFDLIRNYPFYDLEEDDSVFTQDDIEDLIE